MKDEPNNITATLKVVITGEFYDDEASEETLRYCVEQDLEDDGFDVDVELLKEQEPMPVKIDGQMFTVKYGHCQHCGEGLNSEVYPHWCGFCGQAVKWNEFETLPVLR